MSNAVWAAQKALADALTAAGVKTSPALPAKAVAPFRYIMLNTVDPGQTFGSYEVSFHVLCVGKAGESAVVVEQTLDLAVAVVNAIKALDGYSLGTPAIGQPGDFMLNGQPHLAVPVTVTARISRADMEG